MQTAKALTKKLDSTRGMGEILTVEAISQVNNDGKAGTSAIYPAYNAGPHVKS